MRSGTEVVVVEAVRTAVGKRGGSLALTHPIDILGPVQMEALSRAGLDPALVGQVVGGCPGQGGALAGNISRNAWLAHGGPETVAATTVASACGSSQQASTWPRRWWRLASRTSSLPVVSTT